MCKFDLLQPMQALQCLEQQLTMPQPTTSHIVIGKTLPMMAPEVDPSSGLTAVLLLAGVLMIIRGRRS